MSGRQAFFAFSQDRVSDQADLLGISEFLKARLRQLEPFAGPENPVVE